MTRMQSDHLTSPNPYQDLIRRVQHLTGAELAQEFDALPKPPTTALWYALDEARDNPNILFDDAAAVYFHAYRLGTPLPSGDEDLCTSVLKHLAAYMNEDLGAVEQPEFYRRVFDWVEAAGFPNVVTGKGEGDIVKTTMDLVSPHFSSEAVEIFACDELLRREGTLNGAYGGHTILHHFVDCARDKGAVIRHLLKQGADPHQETSTCFSPLEMALSVNRHDHHAQVMIETGVSLAGVNWERVLATNPAAQRLRRHEIARTAASEIKVRRKSHSIKPL